jgi:hypothetical protein
MGDNSGDDDACTNGAARAFVFEQRQSIATGGERIAFASTRNTCNGAVEL